MVYDPTNVAAPITALGSTYNVTDPSSSYATRPQHMITKDVDGTVKDWLILDGHTGTVNIYQVDSVTGVPLSDVAQVLTSTTNAENGIGDDFKFYSLPDGNVVGFDSGTAGMETLKYDTTSGTWSMSPFYTGGSQTGNDNMFETYQTSDGKIYALLAENGNQNFFKYEYNTSTGAWGYTGTSFPSAANGADSPSDDNISGEVITGPGGEMYLVTSYYNGFSSSTSLAVYKIDPASGDILAGSGTRYNNMPRYGQTGGFQVDQNGNIVMFDGGGQAGNGQLTVIDPTTSDNIISSFSNANLKDYGDLIHGDDGYWYMVSRDQTGNYYTQVYQVSPPSPPTNLGSWTMVANSMDGTSGITWSAYGGTSDETETDVTTLSSGNHVVYNTAETTAGGGISMISVSPFAFGEVVNTLGVCFVAGTNILTPNGEVPIETLQAGDLVSTLDHGDLPIRWIGSSRRQAVGNMAPILIREGALGNTRDLRVSPQHRMLIRGWMADLLFGESEVLVAAKHLVDDNKIIRVEGGEVDYFHMLFDDHEIVFAEGSPSESFHPGSQGQKAMSEEQSREIFELFPELEGKFENYGSPARPILKSHEGRVLVGSGLLA